MASTYRLARVALLKGSAADGIQLLVDPIRVMLVQQGAYVPDFMNHQFLSDIPGPAQIQASQALTNKIIIPSGAALAAVFSAGPANVIAPPSGKTVGAMALYKDSGVAATSRLICLLDSGQGMPILLNGDNLIITFDPGPKGIFEF